MVYILIVLAVVAVVVIYKAGESVDEVIKQIDDIKENGID